MGGKYPCQHFFSPSPGENELIACGKILEETDKMQLSIVKQSWCDKCQGKDLNFIKDEVINGFEIQAINLNNPNFTIKHWKKLLEYSGKEKIKEVILKAARRGNRDKNYLLNVIKELDIEID